MKKNPIICCIALGLLVFGLLAGCNKKDTYTAEMATDYCIGLQPGKYIIYRLDSTRFVDFGQTDTVISYQAKDVVDAPVTDNLGRPGWRVIRYLRDTASTNEYDWKAKTTYVITPGRDKIEVLEDNFRFVKLALPINEGYSWKGNGYLPTSPYADLYPFGNDQDIQTWDYTYQNVGIPEAFNNVTYDSTISVLQADESSNLPLTIGVPASRTYWMEKYARNVGLVYKEVIMWEYQPSNGTTSGYRHGFGIKLTILDHN